LRLAALACRTSARTDLFEACAVLSTTPQIAKSAYIETLTRCLAQAMGQTPTLFRPGVAEVSFDEAWLLRAAEAVQNHDSNSFTFLIRSRIPPEHRRNLGYLIGTISEHFRLI
jgi:hypothetical protein